MKILVYYPEIIADQLEPLLQKAGIHTYARLWGLSDDELALKMKGVEVLLSMGASKHVIEAGAPSLKLIQSLGVGVDQIDHTAAKAHNVLVANTRVNSQTTAEYGFALLLACAKMLIPADGSLRKDHWTYSYAGRYPNVSMSGKTLAVIGLGRIGQLIAKWGSAFGMKVIGVRRSGKPFGGLPIYPPSDLMRVLPQADFILVAVASTQNTQGMFTSKEFAVMKPSAIFVNISRGNVVDEAALYDALKERRIASAGIDVWWHYPKQSRAIDNEVAEPSKYPFKTLDNIVMTPHRAGYAPESRMTMFQQIIENILHLDKGEPLINIIDPELEYG